MLEGYKLKQKWKRISNLNNWEEFYLDLNQSKLFGWEMFKDAEKINSICDKIIKGEKFDPVHIMKLPFEYKSFVGYKHFGLNSYMLTKMKDKKDMTIPYDAGHKRAYAYFLMNEPLLCLRYKFDDVNSSKRLDVPVPSLAELKNINKIQVYGQLNNLLTISKV